VRFTPDEIEAAQRTVYAVMPPTPQYAWPLLAERLGSRVWVKHENHTSAGAFKMRGGLTYMQALRQQQPRLRRVISATRGNHGQSIGIAAARYGFDATIVVPHGNSIEKNAGMGSGFAGAAAARAHCDVSTRLVGVVSAHATAYLDSWRAGHVVSAPVTTWLADGMACRLPDAQALEIIRREAEEVIAVTDDEVAQAMRALYRDTHNLAEGAGAAALAGALQQRERWLGKTVGITVSGGNVDAPVFAKVLQAS